MLVRHTYDSDPLGSSIYTALQGLLQSRTAESDEQIQDGIHHPKCPGTHDCQHDCKSQEVEARELGSCLSLWNEESWNQ